MRVTSALFFLLFSFQISAGPGAQLPAPLVGRSTQSIFDGMQSLMTQMCAPASTLRMCFSVNSETCTSRVNGAFETCLRDQKIKYAGMPTLDPRSAADAENNLKQCVLELYTASSATTYRKTAECEKWVPKIKKPAAKSVKEKPKKGDDTAFEDPLDGQRDMVGRYKLRVLHDMRMVQKLKADMEARKTCINDKARRESSITCFKRALKDFEVTSSPQIVQMAVLATYLAIKDKSDGFSPTTADLVDVVLAVNERPQMESFHLWNLQATNDTDRVALNQLRVDDEKILKNTSGEMYSRLLQKLNEPSKSRAPANLSDLKMRIDAVKARRWNYAKSGA